MSGVSSECRAVLSFELLDGGWRESCQHCWSSCSDPQAVCIVLGGAISQPVQQALQDGPHSYG